MQEKPERSFRIKPRHEAILNFIISYGEENGYPPSVREIGDAVGLSSSSSVHANLKKLQRAGYLSQNDAQARTVIVKRYPDGSPYTMNRGEQEESYEEEMVQLNVLGKVAAGEPIFADENVEDTISFPKRFVRHEEAFMLRITGCSMIKAGILDGDYIIVRPQPVAENGEIVVALIGDEATCKRFYREKNGIRLQPENDEMEPIYVENAMIIGKVVGVFRKLG